MRTWVVYKEELLSLDAYDLVEAAACGIKDGALVFYGDDLKGLVVRVYAPGVWDEARLQTP